MAGEHLPALSPRWWEAALRARALSISFRVVRTEGRRAVVEVDQRTLAAARAGWPGPLDGGLTLATVRTWGTLVGAKSWLHDGRRSPEPRGRP